MRHLRLPVLWLVTSLLVAAGIATAGADEPEPLLLSASSARESCTLGSVTTLDYAIEGGVPPYRVMVDGRLVEDLSTPSYIPCRRTAIWSPLEPVGGDGVQRISVSVSDADGSRAYAVAEHELVRPLPAPTSLKVTSGVAGSSAADLLAEWRTRYQPREQQQRRTGDVAIRWRVEGARDWNVEHHRGEQVVLFSYRARWRIDAPPTGERREVQVAQIRHVLDLQAPEALRWTATALVTTAAHPHELQAEATHDAITLSWGPHASGLAYVARLGTVREMHRNGQERRLASGPLFEARFEDLLPDTLYRVDVRLDQGDGFRYAIRQHRFELRTEPAPVGWSPPTRSPTNIEARLIDGDLHVTWTAPSTGARYETLVCAHPPERSWAGHCDRVAPGEAHARVPLDWRITGGTFAITVETRTAPAGVADADLHVPSYDPELPTRGAPPQAPVFSRVSWSHLHPENPKPATWTFRWHQQDADLAEVTWREDGRRIIRETRQGEFSILLRHGQAPEAVRVRLLAGNVRTPWSAEAEVPSIDDSFRNVRWVERTDTLELHWDAPDDESDLVGYRLYVRRNGGEEEVLDVGRQVSAEFPIAPNDEVLNASVATLYEGPLETVHFFYNPHHLGGWPAHPQPLELHVDAQLSECPPAERGLIAVHWRISGGAPAYTVSIGDQLGFHTDDSSGITVVDCRTGAGGVLRTIKASVVDGDGRTAADVLGPGDVRPYWFEEGIDPFEIRFGPRNVYRDRALVSWDACRWRFDAALRWRPAGTEPWTHVLDFPVAHHGDGWRCSGMLEDLAPLTTYEFQIARYISVEQLRRPERLRWSETQTLTTLGPPQELSLVRDGETVSVSWKRQPDAWAYVVGLRAEGRSWWKRYEPSGDAAETVYFYRVPPGLELSVELISPPLKHGEEEIPIGMDPNVGYGH